MATSVSPVLLALILLICCSAAVAQNKCDGIPSGAKYRYMWMYTMTSPTKDNIKAMDAIVQKWMKESCSGALAYGQGPSVATTPSTFGITTVSPTMSFADYVGWSDWASLDGLQSCYEKGLKAGTPQEIRKFAKSAVRLVIPLTPNTGSTTANCPSATSSAPATVRYVFTYMLAKPGADTCKTANSLQAKITAASDLDIRHGDGCDQVTDDSKIYAPTIKNTADYGGFIDFKSVDDMNKYLSSKSPSITEPRAALRALAASSMRGAVLLLDSPPTVQGGRMGRRLQQQV